MAGRLGSQRPGGRTARTKQSVHAAVRALLADADGSAPQAADIAALAGVHPTTIHRRWGSVDALLLEVAVADLNSEDPVPATGDLARDLLAYARRLREGLQSPNGLHFLHAVVSAARDPAIGLSGATGLVQGRLEQFRMLLDAADPGGPLDPTDVVDLLIAPVYLRALLSQPVVLTDDDLDRFVDNLLGIREHRRGT